MQNQINQHFQTLTTFKPRQFQAETISKLLQRLNVLLRAPTGSGKTEAAVAPFLFARLLGVDDFPNKLIYIVPLRTLATSLRDRVLKLVRKWEEKYPPKRPLVVTLQTGENPEDPRFEGDIVFCTIDQILSSFLSIPYSVGRGSANVNAGVVFASYLVFDELHLLDPDRSFATTLKLLEQIQGISPYLLMTATLTQELAQQIQKEVTPRKANPDNVLSLINVEGADLKNIEGSRCRKFSPVKGSLSADVILQDIQQYQRKRVIILMNTVAKSQALFEDLRNSAPNNVEITLLHSRFLPEHRRKKETSLQKIFEEDWQDQNDPKCQVLISTQVVEAGINITSEVMHTQLCPMNALLQRAGRCARFTGEEGQVLVYRKIAIGKDYQNLAESEDDNESLAESENRKRRQFLPYKDEICEFTWTALLEHEENGQMDLPVGFDIEADWINQVHSVEDQAQATKRKQSKSKFEQNFDQAVFLGKKSVAQELIRFVDNRSVFMITEPSIIDLDVSDEVDLRQLQPFSLPKTTLIKIWREYLESHDRTWLFKKVVPPDLKAGESYSLPKAIEVKSQQELTESIRLVVNPSYVSYDNEIGLQIGVDVDNNGYQSPQKASKSRFSQEYSYHMDTYLGHLGRIWTCWQKDFKGELKLNGQPTSVLLTSACRELSQPGGRFIQTKFFQHTSLEQTTALFEFLVFLAVITHDLGKLQITWQAAMRGWQIRAYELYSQLDEKPDFKITNPKDQILAHTDHHPEHDLFKQAYDEYTATNKRPPHAVESAFISFEILNAVLVPLLQEQFHADEIQVGLISHTVEMAAGRHHSAWAKGWEASTDNLELHLQANAEILHSWQRLKPKLNSPLSIPSELPQLPSVYAKDGFDLGKDIQDDDLQYLQLYWLIVRALRICDGRSVQLHGSR